MIILCIRLYQVGLVRWSIAASSGVRRVTCARSSGGGGDPGSPVPREAWLRRCDCRWLLIMIILRIHNPAVGIDGF